MLPAHFMVAGYFSRRTLKMSSAMPRSSCGRRWRQVELGGENDPILVALENALAIVKFALGVAEHANCGAIEEPHLPRHVR